MLSRFSITTTFAYQNTIYFLRFQTIYYLFLILFYCFCIMFLCFFLSIYFFWLFLSFISFSKNNLYYFAQQKRAAVFLYFGRMRGIMEKEKILEVKDLKVSFQTFQGSVQAVRGVSWHLVECKSDRCNHTEYTIEHNHEYHD